MAAQTHTHTPPGAHGAAAVIAAYLRDAEAADLAAVGSLDSAGLAQLGSAVVERAGVRPSRACATVEALFALRRYTVDGAQAGPPPAVQPSASTPTPTDTMLQLGAHVGTWVERIIVVAFALTAIGLALELA